MLLVAGDKTGYDRWYETNVPVADRWFELHRETIKKESTEKARNFKELRNRLTSQARAASEAEYRRLVEEMSLTELRKARELTQVRIAEELHLGQGDVSRLERRTDMYVSTLAGFLKAVGADLEIRAVFPDGKVVNIKQFSEGPEMRSFSSTGSGSRSSHRGIQSMSTEF